MGDKAIEDNEDVGNGKCYIQIEARNGFSHAELNVPEPSCKSLQCHRVLGYLWTYAALPGESIDHRSGMCSLTLKVNGTLIGQRNSLDEPLSG